MRSWSWEPDVVIWDEMAEGTRMHREFMRQEKKRPAKLDRRSNVRRAKRARELERRRKGKS